MNIQLNFMGGWKIPFASEEARTKVWNGIIKEAIQNTLKEKGSDIEVKDSDCPEGFNGNSKDNIVNRLGIAGIQIEKCMEARKQYYTYIAKAVADAIRPSINT